MQLIVHPALFTSIACFWSSSVLENVYWCARSVVLFLKRAMSVASASISRLMNYRLPHLKSPVSPGLLQKESWVYSIFALQYRPCRAIIKDTSLLNWQRWCLLLAFKQKWIDCQWCWSPFHCREDGVGLAAPQVGLNLRLMVFNPTGIKGEPEYVLVNPRIVSSNARTDRSQEGCLSFPSILGDVEVLSLLEYGPIFFPARLLKCLSSDMFFFVSLFFSGCLR